MRLLYKPDNIVYEIFDITYDNVGFPQFLFYRQGQWLRKSAKEFTDDFEFDCGGAGMDALESLPVSLTIRDCNGKRSTFVFDSSAAVLKEVDDLIFDDDEILMVTIGEQIVWTSLGSSFALTPDDLTGFFA